MLLKALCMINEWLKNIIDTSGFILKTIGTSGLVKKRHYNGKISEIGSKIIYLGFTKLKIVWVKITTFFERRMSIILLSFSG